MACMTLCESLKARVRLSMPTLGLRMMSKRESNGRFAAFGLAKKQQTPENLVDSQVSSPQV